MTVVRQPSLPLAVTNRPPCRFEARNGGDYVCGHTHCSKCSAHTTLVQSRPPVSMAHCQCGAPFVTETFTGGGVEQVEVIPYDPSWFGRGKKPARNEDEEEEDDDATDG